ncbi:hypothetical protein L6164_013493 [Bauhinia variegata]|uniref:Uncharacterized protein n=1 Tax=Bauhinia variegata TaxID=167791 RepID=A0ACB9NE76_BAUVA|nr:hypothetical protein L6164_013493 [Bauhinia variegata]
MFIILLHVPSQPAKPPKQVATARAAPTEAGTSSSKDDITGGSVEAERNKLVFFEGGIYNFNLEDLLRASAEILGKGSVGTSYKAVLEEGTTVVVKLTRNWPDSCRSLPAFSFSGFLSVVGIKSVTNDYLIINIFNSLDEPFLISWLQRRNTWQDGVYGTNCPIPPGQNFTYVLQVKDQIGTYFYFPSLAFHKAAGGYRGFKIASRSVIPVPFPPPVADFTVLTGDWYKRNHTDLRAILDGGSDLPFPDGLIINSRGSNAYTFTVDQVSLDEEIPFDVESLRLQIDPSQINHPPTDSSPVMMKLYISSIILKAHMKFQNQDTLTLETQTNAAHIVMHNYDNHHVDEEGTTRGKRIILPSTYVGSRRYMDQLYFDAMTICGTVGYPDIFLTFTCKKKTQSGQRLRLLDPARLKPEDRLDIISQIFKIKLDHLMSDLKTNKVFGKIIANVYTIEFQKRGLPHAHIVIFLQASDKFLARNDIDKIISAEIPNPIEDKGLYDLVKNHMIHGSCGRFNPHTSCMTTHWCSKGFPKNFQETISVNKNGIPVYRRRNTGIFIEKNNVIFDNRHVVPYNATLLKRYQAHINVEWCNQGASIKYLFKYINKGYDHVTTTLHTTLENQHDEIKSYLDCRYVSPCEGCWRIFEFSIHLRYPVVERLYFHLLEQHNVIFL